MRSIKLGIIGCGVIGTRALESSKHIDGIEIVAVADILPDALQRAVANFGIGRGYKSGAELLNKDKEIEAVILSLPTNVRTGLAFKAFKKGKHALLEKPVAMNAKEVERMIKAKGNLIAGCCSSRFSHLESSKVAADFVAKGTLGKIRLIRSRGVSTLGQPPKSTPPAWRLIKALNGGGILMNWGCYDLDYILGILGWKLKPKTVLAMTWNLAEEFPEYAAPGSDAETHCAAIIKCEDNTAITFERGELACARTEGAWDIIGTNGSLHLSMQPADGKKIIYFEGIKGQGAVEKVLWEGNEPWDAVHIEIIRDFADAVRNNRQPKTDMEKALVIQKITDAIYKSAKNGKAVKIS